MIPCGDREDKKARTPGVKRLEMTSIAVKDMFPEGYPVEVSDIEVRNGKTIPTFRLMK